MSKFSPAGQRYLWLGCFGALCLMAAAAPVIAPHDPLWQNLSRRFAAPGTPSYPLGTDNLGRDLLSRIVWGMRPSLTVGLLAMIVGGVPGLLIGVVAALRRRTFETLSMLVMDSILGFPAILLALITTSTLGVGVLQTAIAIGIIFIPVFARLTRAETAIVLNEEYVLAARSLGAHPLRIALRHVLPNIASLVGAQAALTVSSAIVISTALSFLGFGVQPPTPDWGLILKDARDYLFQAPWLAIFPGVALCVTILCAHRLADALSHN